MFNDTNTTKKTNIIQKKAIKSFVLDNINFFEKEGKHIVVDYGRCKYKIKNGSLKELVQQLPDQFVRCHQSFIVNIENIDELRVFNRNLWEIDFIEGLDTALITKDFKDKLFYPKGRDRFDGTII